MGKTLLAERNRVSFSSTEVVGGTVCLGLPSTTHPPSHDPAPTTHFVFLRRFVRNFIRLHCVNICRMRGEARTRGYLISRCGTEIMLTAVYTYIYGMYQGFSRIQTKCCLPFIPTQFGQPIRSSTCRVSPALGHIYMKANMCHTLLQIC